MKQWDEEAIILSARKFKERDLIITVFAYNEGIFSGVVRAGQSKNNASIYQPGNIVRAVWKARLEEQLGNFTAELTDPIAAKVLSERERLEALMSMAVMLRSCLPERDPDNELYIKAIEALHKISLGEEWLRDYILFELELLKHLGFGLDFSECAATGATEDLKYVSPKTGRAVSEKGAVGYENKLLKLPNFLQSSGAILESCLHEGLKLTEYFLAKNIFHPQNKGMPDERSRLYKSYNQKIGFTNLQAAAIS